jgi:hypothetical protein
MTNAISDAPNKPAASTRVVRVAMVFAAALVAVGCSSGSDAPASNATPAKPPAVSDAQVTTTAATEPDQTSDASPVTAGGAPPSGIDPCSIVTTDDVAAAFGGDVAAGVINPDNGGCDYEITGQTKTGDSGVLTQVSIEFGGDYEGYDHTKVVFPDIEKIDGLGDEAWYYSLASQLHINLGGKALVISGLFPGDDALVKDEVVAFGHTVVDKL